jgi:hypothetical protein
VIYFKLGVVLLLAAIFPFALKAFVALLLLIFPLLKYADWSFTVVIPCVAFFLTYLAISLLVKRERVTERLPPAMPGLSYLQWGVIITGVYYLLVSIALNLHQTSFLQILGQFSLILYVGRVLIVVGVTKTLVSLSPLQNP